MGIGRMAAALLTAENKRRPFFGSVLQLGRQDVGHRPAGYDGPLHDEPLLKWYGFDTVHSCDVSDYERPTFTFDLNERVVGYGVYDLILDGGTLEHVFHLPNALENIHDMLKINGRIVHMDGVSNWIEHGFYGFSPCFFWDYYEANGYEINDCLMVASGEDEGAVRHVYRYRPGCLDSCGRGHFTASRFGGKDVWELFFVATKLPGSTCGKVPQQSRLKSLWGNGPKRSGQLEYVGPV